MAWFKFIFCTDRDDDDEDVAEPQQETLAMSVISMHANSQEQSDHTSSSSTTIIANSEDLVSEILLHLPIKCLLRFKSVSKQWLFLISHPLFIHEYNRRNPISVSGFFFPTGLSRAIYPQLDFVLLDGNIAADIPFTHLHDPVAVEVLHSCNGLLLCSGRIGTLSGLVPYHVHNPATKQHRTLPLRPSVGMVSSASIAFDPCRSPHYKVVLILNPEFSDLLSFQIELYSSETGHWRLCGEPFNLYGKEFTPGVFWNGAMHWIRQPDTFLCFDVERECLRTMPPLPQLTQALNRRGYLYFGESQGHLHLIVANVRHQAFGPETTSFAVLEMEKDYSGWFVKYQVDLDALIYEFPEILPFAPGHQIDTRFFPIPVPFYQYSVLNLIRGGGGEEEEEEEEEESWLVLHVPGKVISYSLKDKSTQLLRVSSDPAKDSVLRYFWDDIHPYIETLSCI
ncbi:PREDICTED: F-box protein At5g07610-like [Nelumbo nucifera]|uniref:F-box protein At5g07610-like n=2 Tax=Nelumbo nucifera TaxID=4432 RepID=A0A1U8ALK9_NELNU|nr:PREDICTED: F-box protein At5g07610-like [Nelumbo nucifera]DAD46132.1 TPA_asm: hypothetical protein HUJ06_004362 [Nelumbo nucifera]